jgi:hypothetical protein
MNSNGIYAVGKIGCTILALAKTIVFSAYPQLFIYGLYANILRDFYNESSSATPASFFTPLPYPSNM